MTKMMTLIFSTLLFMSEVFGQVTVIGTVTSKGDKLPLPGVAVVEKHTKNGTMTSDDGSFSLKVADQNSVLVFSFVGMVTQEHSLKGQTLVWIKMKDECHKDYFDGPKIIVYGNMGLIMNPLGGQIDMLYPPVFRYLLFRSSFGFQTDPSKNTLLNAKLELLHTVSNCEFDMDFRGHFRNIYERNDLKAKIYSFEADLNDLLNRGSLNCIIGYGNINFNKTETNKNISSHGPVIGLGTFIGRPFYTNVDFKISFFKGVLEYQSSIKYQYRNLHTFLKFHKLDSFTELSLGVGFPIRY